ncbi:MAG: hypothetical protein IT381_23675 [Deltaproteobacteria bacterium]|nr:hypothetical protein [Deltaproteobacteria bacterium]
MNKGKALYRRGDFGEATAVFDAVLSAPESQTTERVEAHLYFGFCQIALDNETAAQERFLRALELDPNIELPRGLPPKIVSAFERAKTMFEALAIEPMTRFMDRTEIAVTFHFKVVGRDRTGLLTLCAKPEAEAALACAELKRDGDAASATLPIGTAVHTVEYFVTATKAGRMRSVLGAADTPRRASLPDVVPSMTATPPASVTIRPSTLPTPESVPLVVERVPVFKQWWFWTVIGVVVAGGVATAVAVPLATAATTAATKIALSFE